MTTQVETQENTQKNTPANSANNVINLAPNRKPKQQTVVADTLKNATAPRMLLSTLKNNFNSAQKANKVNSFADKMNERNYAAEMLPAMQQPRSVENVEKVSGLQNERIAKTATPQYAQYAGDDVEQMAGVYTATPGFRDDVDYDSVIKDLSLQPVTPENQAIMRNMLASRNAKIAAGGADMTQYADDEVSVLAKDYLKQYAPEKIDTNAIYDRADVREENNYAEAERSLAQQQRLQLANLEANYEAQRRAADLAYAMKSRNMEAVLAEQGLGRGLGAGPSSGYSESARLGALSDYANNINQTYQQQTADARELAAQFEAQRMQAMAERNVAIRANDEARIAQMNEDRTHSFDAHQFNRNANTEEMLATAQKDNLSADSALKDKEVAWYDAEKTADIASKNADTEHTIAQTAAVLINNQTLDERNRAEIAAIISNKEMTDAEKELKIKETVWYDERARAEIDSIIANTGLTSEQAIAAWINNQTLGEKNRAEIDSTNANTNLTNEQAVHQSKENEWYDTVVEAEVDEARSRTALNDANAAKAGMTTYPGSGKSSTKKEKSSTGSSNGGYEGTYGDSVLDDVQDALTVEGERSLGILPSSAGAPTDWTVAENGAVVEPAGPQAFPFGRHSI